MPPRSITYLQHTSLTAGVIASAMLFAQIPTQAQSLQSSSQGIKQIMGRQPPDIMRRDLGLNAESLDQYNRIEAQAIATLPAIETELGDAYAGAWIERSNDGRHRLIVATTRPTAAKSVHATDAEFRGVQFSLAQLNASKVSLDRIGKQRTRTSPMYAWYVDVKSNRLIVSVDRTKEEHAIDMIASSDIDVSQVKIIATDVRPRPLQFVQQIMMGGDSYLLKDVGYCSVGFSAFRNGQRGFITAGHCGGVGTPTYRVYPGPYSGWLYWIGGLQLSIFPGNDFAWSSVANGQMFIYGQVRSAFLSFNNLIPVRGDQAAPVGASICRSGFNTGLRCGVIEAQNVTVDYGAATGIVFGLTQTTACAGPGDSGGSFITPSGQAQGVLSGGTLAQGSNDNCSLPTPTTFYQPLQPLMTQNGITLQLTN
jgi:hypothetical protein